MNHRAGSITVRRGVRLCLGLALLGPALALQAAQASERHGSGSSGSGWHDSVFSWGRWASLAPAAGGTPALNLRIPGSAVPGLRPGEADRLVPRVQVERKAQATSGAGGTGVPGVVPVHPDQPVRTGGPTPPPPPTPVPGVHPANPASPINQGAGVPLPPPPPTPVPGVHPANPAAPINSGAGVPLPPPPG